MGDGKKGPAPCGHEGEAIIGQYYMCPRCDTDDDITIELVVCPYCKSIDVDEDFEIDPVYYFFNPTAPILDTRCNDCGKCWLR
jgi:hypothetical protein